MDIATVCQRQVDDGNGVIGFVSADDLVEAIAVELGALAAALTAVIVEPDAVQERETVELCCEAGDDELLLAAWLNAIVSQMAVRRMLFRRFRVELQPGRLTGTATGERVVPERHQPAVEVKGATYTSLRVAPMRDGGWLAQTVVDV